MLDIALCAVLKLVVGVSELPPHNREEFSHVINELLSPRVTATVSSVNSIVVLSIRHLYQKILCGLPG